MEKEKVGSFYATSMEEKTIEFIVNNDHTIDCPELNLYGYLLINLKPRLLMWNGNGYYRYDSDNNGYYDATHLIKKYSIDEELFKYLQENRMIIFSSDMAYLFEFNELEKNPKEEGHILVKKRNEKFN